MRATASPLRSFFKRRFSQNLIRPYRPRTFRFLVSSSFAVYVSVEARGLSLSFGLYVREDLRVFLDRLPLSGLFRGGLIAVTVSVDFFFQTRLAHCIYTRNCV